MIKENQKFLNRLFVAFDALCILLALILSWHVRFKSGLLQVSGLILGFDDYVKPAIFILPVYLVLYYVFKLYKPYRFKNFTEEFINIINSNIVGILIFILFLYLFKIVDYSRFVLFLFAINCTLITALERISIRFFLRNIRRKGFNLKHILIVGYSSLSDELIERFHRNKQWGYSVVGILDDNSTDVKRFSKYLNKVDPLTYSQVAASSGAGEKIIGKIDKLECILNTNKIDEVFITLDIREYEKLNHIINVCEKCGVRAQIVPDYIKYLPSKPYVEELDGLPIINLRYIPLDNIINKITKRVFDIIVSLMCIIISSGLCVCRITGIVNPFVINVCIRN